MKKLTSLRRLQLAELDAMKEFVRICKKHGLTYYISGGTYLGAVRHKGFIPWDDDMDVAMPRTDYEKLLTVASDIDPRFELVTFHNKKDYYWYPSRLLNKKVLITTRATRNEHVEAAWIDIFPLDGLPKSKVLSSIQKFRLMRLRAFYRLSDFDNLVDIKSKKKRPLYEIILIFVGKKCNVFKFLNTKKQLAKIDKALKKYSEINSPTYMNFMGSYKLKSIISKEVYGNGAYYDFEGMKLFGPEDYDAYLSTIYGNYMEPPKEDDRNKHNSEVIS
ncbi:LicD family protein [Candidatus Saccharibacteria bacterium]|nr:LicD family protein [Candidatus Saccharibacteria bacterium]